MPNPNEGKYKKRRSGRTEGDFIAYTILHNAISMVLFFIIVAVFGLFDRRTQTLTEIISLDFLALIGIIFLLSFALGIISRGLAYLIMYQFNTGIRKREMKKIGEINTGINRLSLSWMVSLFIGSIAFSIGAVIIIQLSIFGEETFFGMLIAYIIMKIFVFITVKLLSSLKF